MIVLYIKNAFKNILTINIILHIINLLIGENKMPRTITREEFDVATAAIWNELKYQDNLPRRTDDEAKDVPGFLTLARRYERHVEDAWADSPGVGNPPVVIESLNGLRKLTAIYLRSMIYCGVVER